MAKFRILTANEMSNDAVERWRQQYSHWAPENKFHDGKTKAEHDAAFDSVEHTPENISKIIGNKGWTHPDCTACGQRHQKVVSFCSYYSEEETKLCGDCIKKLTNVAKDL